MSNWRQGKSYIGRKRVLASLGFSSYRDYLNSDLWKELREWVLKRDDFSCLLCGLRATQVHHKKYDIDTMKGLSTRELVSLCGQCHEGLEFSERGKRSVGGAWKALKRARRSAPPPGNKLLENALRRLGLSGPDGRMEEKP